jgi:hypothetical protein
MNSLILSQDYEIWDPDLEYQTYIGPINDSLGKYSPETVFEYMYECCLVISDLKSWRKTENRITGNREIVAEYKRTHACERCGVRSDNPFKFVFFEMHLPKRDRICVMIHWAGSDQIKQELLTRGMYCRKCSRLIVREVTENIPAPPVKPGSTDY